MVVENRTIFDFTRPSLEALGSSITRKTVDANNFEIKYHVIHMIQSLCTFHGLPDEDPHAHIANFLEICDTFKLNGVSNDAWLNSLPTGSITTWDDLAHNFLSNYFPPAKTAKLRNDITTFTREDGESLYEAWERFKDMLRKCPHHGLEVWLQVSSFYNRLHNQARQTLDATSGGIFGNKRPQEAYNLIEEIAMNCITTNTEHVDFIGTNRLQNNPYSNTYNLGWRNHPNFSRKDNNNQGQSGFGPQQQQQFQQRLPQNYQPRQQLHGTSKPSNGLSLEDAVTKFISITESQALLEDSRHKQYEEKFSLHEAEFRTQKATLQPIETQLGQIAKLFLERQPGCLPSNTETNPKANVSAITLRNSKVYPEPQIHEEEVQ
ncbi:hypothetical protein L1987_32775 [Smallanthus sonchifolius]|uniref:Uncharacterized protein n=1 Tax=Smallanthus sonchifolius TaxID=185202 RepID=A0ACB9HRR8_9ASTR|nr:hypothetical protein L1987_32775 [Smallanthus sonchifolius]